MAIHYKLSIPARINILGNPADANEGDFATISAAVDMYARAEIRPADHVRLTLLNADHDRNCTCEDVLPVGCTHGSYDDELCLIKAGIKVLWNYSEEFRQKYQQQGFDMRFCSEVPRQSGLGGSSLLVLLLLGGMRAFYQLDPHLHNDYVISELTQRAEADELGIACGFADRIVPLFGGIAYTDYRGKLHPKPVDEAPYTTYERLDDWVQELPLVLGSTGVRHNSGDVHGKMRPRYIKEHDEYVARGGEMPPMVRWMSSAWETAWRGKIALLKRDWTTFGTLMTRNHFLVNEMMNYCGFTDGAGWANNLFIEAARSHALGAKLTGAGGGGSVFALSSPGHEDELIERWQQIASEHQLTDALIQKIQITRTGLTVEAE